MDHSHHQMAVQAWSWLLPLTVFTTSLVGSLHCGAMCGGIALVFSEKIKDNLLYNLGRGLIYILMGYGVGHLGQHALHLIDVESINLAASLLMALVLFIMALQILTRKNTLPLPQRFTSWLEKLSGSGFLRLRKIQNPQARAFLGGSLTAFLPCGFLYSGLIGALALASPWKAALFMLAFWMGTVPAMSAGVIAIRKFLQPLLERFRQLIAYALIAINFILLYMRVS